MYTTQIHLHILTGLTGICGGVLVDDAELFSLGGSSGLLLLLLVCGSAEVLDEELGDSINRQATGNNYW